MDREVHLRWTRWWYGAGRAFTNVAAARAGMAQQERRNRVENFFMQSGFSIAQHVTYLPACHFNLTSTPESDKY
jgi:hypothetical protein